MCSQFAKEVCEDDYVPEPARLEKGKKLTQTCGRRKVPDMYTQIHHIAISVQYRVTLWTVYNK